MDVLLVQRVCSKFSIGTFEELSRHHRLKCLFWSDENERHVDPRNLVKPKDVLFDGEYLKGFRLFGRVRIAPSLVGRLLFGKYDILICNVGGAFAFPVAVLAAWLRRKPVVIWASSWHLSGTLLQRIGFPFMRLVYKRANAIVTYGEHVKEFLIPLGVSEKKIFVAWHTIDNSLFNRPVSVQELDQLRNDLGIVTEHIILFVGRLEIEKGIYYLLDAFKRMRAHCSLLMIGNGPERGAIKEKCIREEIGHVYILDYVDNSALYKYYALADVFVLPSITTRDFKEPWGVVVNEAMNQGCPVVASNAVGAAMGGLVVHGETGLIVEERDAEALYRAIDTILSDKELWNSMRRRSREMIAEWTYERMVRGFLDAIDYASGGGMP